MKTAATDNPVRLDWLREQGLRLDAAPYLSGAFTAKQLLKRLPVRKDALASLTAGHNGGIFNGPKFSRVYVNDPEAGVPFLGSTDMMEADLTHLPLLGQEVADRLPYLEIQPGMTLISCSGTIGRMTYVRSDMRGIWSSQHVMKVQVNPERVKSGYLNAFLRSRYGVPIIASHAYGAIIQHIEPHHIANLPIPRFGDEVEGRIHDLVEEAASLRTDFQHGVQEATRDLFTTAGLEELLDLKWHEQPRDLGSAVYGVNHLSLRGMNYAARAARIKEMIESVQHLSLGSTCWGGELSRGNRFNRVDLEEGYGIPFVGQRQAFWLRPEVRWIQRPKSGDLRAQDETIMVTSRGLPSENGLFGRAMFVTGDFWVGLGYTEDFLRIRPGRPDISGAYLFAFLRSEVAFRMFRSMMAGTGPQAIHRDLQTQMPVPLLAREDRTRVEETVRSAYRKRDEADKKEDRAMALLEQAVAQHAGGR